MVWPSRTEFSNTAKRELVRGARGRHQQWQYTTVGPWDTDDVTEYYIEAMKQENDIDTTTHKTASSIESTSTNVGRLFKTSPSLWIHSLVFGMKHEDKENVHNTDQDGKQPHGVLIIKKFITFNQFWWNRVIVRVLEAMGQSRSVAIKVADSRTSTLVDVLEIRGHRRN